MKKIINMSFLSKVKVCLIFVVLVATLAFTNASAGQVNISSIPYNDMSTKFANKTTSTARTSAKFTLTNGNPRRIVINTFSRDMTNLFQNGLVVVENGPYKSNNYISGKPSST